MGKKKLGTDLPDEAVDEWHAYCDAHGDVRCAATVAAFRLFRLAPADLRDLAKVGDAAAIAAWFEHAEIEGFRRVLHDALGSALAAHLAKRPVRGRKARGKS